MDLKAWRAETKNVAKSMFGRPSRVLVAAWVIDRGSEAFFLLEAQIALQPHGAALSAVRDDLEQFVGAGMLQSVQIGNRRYFQPLPHPLWHAWRGIGESLGLLVSAKVPG